MLAFVVWEKTTSQVPWAAGINSPVRGISPGRIFGGTVLKLAPWAFGTLREELAQQEETLMLEGLGQQRIKTAGPATF